MAYGEDLPPPNFKEILKKAREDMVTPPEKDRFDECKCINCLVKQIVIFLDKTSVMPYYLRQGGYVFVWVCLWVCEFVCEQDNSKT